MNIGACRGTTNEAANGDGASTFWKGVFMADVIVAAILILLIGAAVYKVFSDKKKGICSCGQGCESCSHGCSAEKAPERFRLKK